MADYPTKLKHKDGRERVAYSIGDQVKAEFDGFAGPKAKTASAAADKTPAQKATATRRKNKAAKADSKDSAGDAGKSTDQASAPGEGVGTPA